MFRSNRLIKSFVVLFILQFFGRECLLGTDWFSLRQAVEQGKEEKYQEALDFIRTQVAKPDFESIYHGNWDPLDLFTALVQKKYEPAYKEAEIFADKNIRGSGHNERSKAFTLFEALFNVGYGEERAIAVANDWVATSKRENVRQAIGLCRALVREGQNLSRSQQDGIIAVVEKIINLNDDSYIDEVMEFSEALIKKGFGYNVAADAFSQGIKSISERQRNRARIFFIMLFEAGQGEEKALAIANEFIESVATLLRKESNSKEEADLIIEKFFRAFNLFRALVENGKNLSRYQDGIVAVFKKIISSLKGSLTVYTKSVMELSEVLVTKELGYEVAAEVASKGIDWNTSTAVKLFKLLFEKKQGYEKAITVIGQGLEKMGTITSPEDLRQKDRIRAYCDLLFKALIEALKKVYAGEPATLAELEEISSREPSRESLNNIKKYAAQKGLIIKEEKAPEPEKPKEPAAKKPTEAPAAEPVEEPGKKAEPSQESTIAEKKLLAGLAMVEQVVLKVKFETERPELIDSVVDFFETKKSLFEKLYSKHLERLEQIYKIEDLAERIKALQEFIAHPEKRNVVEAESDADALIKSLATLKTKLVQLSSMLSEV